MVDVEKRRLGLKRQELGLATGDDQVRELFVHHGEKPRRAGVLDDGGVLVHQRLHPVEVLQGRVLGAGGQDLHPQLRERVHHGPGLHPAGEKYRAFSCQPLPVRCQFGAAGRFALGDQLFHPVLHGAFFQTVHRVVQLTGDVAQRLGHVGHAVKRLLDVRDAVVLLHLLGKIGQALRADDDVQLGPVRVAQVLELGIAADAREHADAELIEKRQHAPEVARYVVLTNQVDVVVSGEGRFSRADDVFQQRLAGQPVADVLVADEAGGIHRNHRDG